MSIRSLLALLPLVALLACGPAPPMTSTGGGSGSSSAAGSSSTSFSTSSATAAPTTGTTSTGPVDPGSTGAGEAGFITSDDVSPDTTCVRSGSPCDLWCQNCPPGEKCAPYSGDGDNSWESQKCVRVDNNPGQIGDPCTVEGSAITGIDTCDISAICWNVDPVTLEGTCVGFCAGTPEDPMCPPGTSCTIANNDVIILCLPTCGPLVQDCPVGDACILNPVDPEVFVCFPDLSGDGGQVFGPCEDPGSCDPGLACRAPHVASECDPMAPGCCTPFCDTGAPDCPGVMQQCLPWYEMGLAPPGLEHVGVCSLPE